MSARETHEWHCRNVPTLTPVVPRVVTDYASHFELTYGPSSWGVWRRGAEYVALCASQEAARAALRLLEL